MKYTELQVTSNFTFLRGASHPEELAEQAAALGYTEIAITDRNSFAGVVRAHVAAKKAGIRLMVGCRIVQRSDGTVTEVTNRSEAVTGSEIRSSQ